MMRMLTLAAALAAAIALPAIAEDVKAPAAGTNSTAATFSLTSQEAQSWVGKPVYSSDGSKLGEVASFQRTTDNKVTEMQANIGGFLGFGEHRIRLMPAQFSLKTDRVVLDLTAAQAKELPKISN